MIKVNRGAVPPPVVLTDAKRAGPKETKRAIDFFVQGKGKAPAFAAYRDKDVKQALEQLFQKKCAYCESSYQAVMPFPVEHWRPKGRVTLDDGSKKEPGYFWLAAQWDNLFLSCNDCNGERAQVELPSGSERLMGKLDRFPLTDETKRASAPGAEGDEEPLLLNPCSDEPSEHLEFFDPNGERAILRPKVDSSKGTRSIELYALNRLGLVRERQKLVASIVLLRSQLDRNLSALDENPSPNVEALIVQNIREALAELVRLRLLSSPYAALARREIDSFLVPLLQRFGLPALP